MNGLRKAHIVRPNTSAATGTILFGLVLTYAFLPSDNATGIFATAAIGVGLSLGVATAIEASVGLPNLIRVDWLMLWVLYGLTLLEFIFPQSGIETAVSPAAALSGAEVVLVGMGGLAIGRHLIATRQRSWAESVRLRAGDVFLLFVFAAGLGYLHILLAVSFDPLEMLRQMSLPRFSQSWGRGRLGDVYALIYELGLLITLIPPIAGLIYARASEYRFSQKLFVAVVALLTFYYAFASGTRNVLATHVFTFLGAYFLTRPRLAAREIIALGVPSLILLAVGSIYMLEFRNLGVQNYSFSERQYSTLFIDQNIVNIARLTQVFPDLYGYLGFDVPYNALIRPIPRVLWPGKPEGLTTSIETALGVGDAMTLSCTFAGEAYMAGGLIAVLLAGLLFGAGAAWWNRLRYDLNSQFSQLLYASGFLCAAIAMRSMLSMAPVALPTLALWLYGRFWLPRSTRNHARPQISRTNVK